MDNKQALDKLREAKREALVSSCCNIKIGRRELEVAIKVLEEKELPDMRGKIKEYIAELDENIDMCRDIVEDKLASMNESEKEIYVFSKEYITLMAKAMTLGEVKNDLQGRLEELV